MSTEEEGRNCGSLIVPRGRARYKCHEASSPVEGGQSFVVTAASTNSRITASTSHPAGVDLASERNRANFCCSKEANPLSQFQCPPLRLSAFPSPGHHNVCESRRAISMVGTKPCCPTTIPVMPADENPATSNPWSPFRR